MDFYQSWEGSVMGGLKKTKKSTTWAPPQQGQFKFNVDGATWGKLGPAGIGSVIRDHNGEPLVVFVESIVRKESNEAELLSIRKALTIWISLGLDNFMIESDSQMRSNGYRE